LLRSAANGRPLEAVIVESIDRLSRMTADGARIERDPNCSTSRCSPPTSR
jgi:DNA invertase Pin-like site-specific DNA recombinase